MRTHLAARLLDWVQRPAARRGSKSWLDLAIERLIWRAGGWGRYPA
ncbi:MAG: hypothetical protein ACRDXE_10485 [Acidimicrobiales bacterium]